MTGMKFDLCSSQLVGRLGGRMGYINLISVARSWWGGCEGEWDTEI